MASPYTPPGIAGRNTQQFAEAVDRNVARAFESIYGRTAAEIAAGVTPSNFAYPPGDVRRYGASPSATPATNRAAFQAAANSTHHIYLPKLRLGESFAVDGIIDLTATGQCVFGEGLRSTVVQTGTGADATVFRALNLGQNEFHNVYVVPGTEDLVNVQDGFGFAIVNSSYCVVRNCRVDGHRRGGILLWASNHCKVLDNWVVDSVVDPSLGDTQSDAGIDIYLYGACTHNIIRGNHCVNGAGVGIAVQTVTSGDIARNNIIEGNEIAQQDQYGIMLYILNANDKVEYTIVRGNRIDTITGNIPEDGGLFNYGAGIYVQTADHVLIDGNLIRNTNIHTPALQQVPAAIGISGIANCVVTNNLIEDANYWGIAAIQATAYTAAGRGLIIANNSVRVTNQRGVFLQDVVSATVTGNRVYSASAGASAEGILVRQVSLAQSDDFVVKGNRVEGFATGIQVTGTVNRAVVADNIVRNNTGGGIVLSASTAMCHDNIVVQNAGGDGIVLNATCLNGYCVRNVVSGGDFGIVDDGGGALRVDDNQVLNAVTAYSTSFVYLLENSATPSVKNKRWVQSNHTTTITNLADGYEGQVVTLRAGNTFTLQNGSGLDLAGAADFVMNGEDMVTLVRIGSAWKELSRSEN